MDPIVLAGVVLEVAAYYPDIDLDIPRAEWRWNMVEKAIEIVKECDITIATEDIDELIHSYLSNQEALP
jgi:hypothetical protein